MIVRRIYTALFGEPVDPVIDGLIANNVAAPIGGMEAADWRVFNRVGQQRWRETVQAQRRTNRPVLMERKQA